MKKGTYYVETQTSWENYSSFTSNVNTIIASIPIKKVFAAKVSTAKNKDKAVVKWENVLGSYVDFAEFQPGNVSISNVKSSTYWKYKIIDDNFGGGNKSCQVLKEKDGYYTFTVTKIKKCTIMLEDTNDQRWSTVLNTGIDVNKPVVKGIKNNKTYTKAVKVTFSDKESGIKSAKLNGKAIKSGQAVNKSSTYTLVVSDKAGNKTTVKFKIK